MANPERPLVYLITPPEIDLSVYPAVLGSLLDATDVACVRLALSSQEEDDILRTGDALREITHSRDIPLVIENHVKMVDRLGLDGVHLSDGANSVRETRKDMGADAIIGAYCGTSRHGGMNAGEAGADYISFGPIGATSLGDGTAVDIDIFKWWSDVIEIPVVAEGGLNEDNLATICSITDFVAFGSELWSTDDPAKRLVELVKSLG